MDSIKVMVNGLPGNVAVNLTRHILADDRFTAVPFSLTGPEITAADHTIDTTRIQLIRPQDQDSAIAAIKAEYGDFISVDFTHPSAVNPNAEFYCRQALPFVMGTTGGDREHLAATVRSSSISAVIAPNMAKQIVGFQAMMEYAATTFPGLFCDYSMTVRESHQQGKADTSGTARAIIRNFNQLGIDLSEGDIQMERNPEIQRSAWKIPEEHIGGHGWHTYTLTSPDKTVCFEFTHNVNGRDIYALGTMDAINFLYQQVTAGSKGTVFTMIDVLRAGGN